jgi:hypothetical protein
MARFTTVSLAPPAPPPGVNVAKVVKAREKTSEAGNTVLLMTAKFPQGEELSFALTFTEATRKVVTYFCRSLELELPKDEGIEIEVKPSDVEGRYFYPVVELDGQGFEAVPRITRFLSRSEALATRPELAGVVLQPQAPRVLGPVAGRSRL